MKTSLSDVAFLFFGLVLVLGLSACDMYHETYISPNKIRVEESNFFEQVPVNEANEPYLAAIAQGYDKHGRGPMDVTVTYDVKSKTNTSMRASNNASRIGSVLRENGVSDINISIMPVNQAGNISNVLLSYDSYNVKPPKDCTVIDGMQTTQSEATPDYKLGCSVNAVIARQVARPKDLAESERENTSTDGRRNSNIVERYRTGEPNKTLEGETASD